MASGPVDGRLLYTVLQYSNFPCPYRCSSFQCLTVCWCKDLETGKLVLKAVVYMQGVLVFGVY